jgi:hypothetical protein
VFNEVFEISQAYWSFNSVEKIISDWGEVNVGTAIWESRLDSLDDGHNIFYISCNIDWFFTQFINQRGNILDDGGNVLDTFNNISSFEFTEGHVAWKFHLDGGYRDGD